VHFPAFDQVHREGQVVLLENFEHGGGGGAGGAGDHVPNTAVCPFNGLVFISDLAL
jgi:hypothetical protein